MRVTAFQGASNRESYEVKKNGEPFNLTTAGVTKIEVVSKGQSISSDTSAVSYSGSVLTIEWGALGDDLSTGVFSPTIYAYKSGDTKGEVIFGPTLEPIYLSVIDDERA